MMQGHVVPANKRLEDAMFREELSINKLSQRSGVSRITIRRMLRDLPVTRLKAGIIASRLNSSIEELGIVTTADGDAN